MRNYKATWLSVLGTCYIIAWIVGLGSFFNPLSANVLLGIIALLVTTKATKSKKGSLRFAIAALVFVVLYTMIPAKTFFLAAIICSIGFTVETFVGRLDHKPIFIIVLITPIFEYLSNVFSFPVRLSLSSAAGKILSYMQSGVLVEGNMIHAGSAEFSVDPTCMGLHMLVTSLIAAVILTGIYQQKTQKTVPVGYLTGLLAIVFVANMLSNLFRIIVLVRFNALPDTWMHEVLGILCFVVYVVFPANFLVRFWVQKFGKKNRLTGAGVHQTPKFPVLINVVLALAVMIAGYGCKDMTVNSRMDVKPAVIAGFTSKQLQDRVTKLENGNALVYVKPIAGFYSSDHQPAICWRGSGYAFKQVTKTGLGNMQVYKAVLHKKKALLYTAWWYQSGDASTTGQMDWRWKALKESKKYVLVNVTVARPELLEKEVLLVAAGLRPPPHGKGELGLIP